MTAIRSLIRHGYTSQGITVPASWLRYVELQKGKCVTAVTVEESNDCLIIKPYFEKIDLKMKRASEHVSN
ncbi:MAG: hypothetical protein LBH74_05505 [Nitrososphaerota archaeon]|nr:hypothetical protein [Nitrososphaerota archaeon]